MCTNYGWLSTGLMELIHLGTQLYLNKLIKRVSHEQQLGVLRTGNYVQECFRWIFQAMCTNYGWLSTGLMELIHLGKQLYVNKLS